MTKVKPKTKTPVKINRKAVDAGIIKRWKAIHTSAGKTSEAIQKELLTLISHYEMYQDVRIINACLFSEKSGIRTNAIKAYMETFCSIRWDSKEDKFKHKKSGKNDLAGAKNTYWATFTKETPYKSVNISKQVASLIKRATKDLEEHKNSTCSRKELAMLKKLHKDMVEKNKQKTIAIVKEEQAKSAPKEKVKAKV